jgi:hypothetical protein
MHSSRRHVLLTSFAAAFGALFTRVSAAAAPDARQSSTQNPLPRTRTPRQPGDPEDPENPNGNPPAASSKALLEQRQKDIKKEIERLYELASQLKTEIEKTDSTAILSLPMLKKAEEIEKLAKHIKDNARG